ncbi:cytochrome P450 [Actinocrinis puniceicyclus]|uniref:Cytochrome P450 n=1 Tax=Actinocrinis puniceicyclus TaxID=977794 RepID=A0A8J8BCQ6_9ACTN|nr:cytochrome P450 [Actinocrinis puniceicyclus]MBS2965362.1 cytochrome P450 [Actinocrinis puniceicyclus]
MTLPADQPSVGQLRADSPAPAAPPPGCPAHQAAARLYGGEAEADPAGLYAKLREQHGPVAPVLLEGEVPAWLILGYRENMEAARTPTRFSRDARIWREWQEGRVRPDSPLIPMVGWRPDCVSQDGEEHQRLRSAVNDSLGRFDRHGVRRHIQRYANQLIDGFAPLGRADLLAQYAQHLPMLVLTRLFGLPEEFGPRLVEASTGLIKGGEKAVAYNEYIMRVLSDLAATKSAEPGYDFASWLIAHPAGLTEDEVQNHLRLVLIAANETTTNLIANTLRVVLTDPRFRASLTGGLMTIPDAVEQVLWDEPPLMVCPGRFATGDMEFGGQQIRAGDLLVLGLAAGNTDPAVRPDLSTPVHGNRSHLAFSRGPHECPGQDIGRAVTDCAVDALLARLPDIHLAVPEQELNWTSSTWSRHLDVLPAEFTPRRVAQVPAQRLATEPRPASVPRTASQGAAQDGAQGAAQGAPRSAPQSAESTAPEAAAAAVPAAAPGSGWRALIRRFFGI